MSTDVMISGASGFLGSRLIAHFQSLTNYRGHGVSRTEDQMSVENLLFRSTAKRRVVILGGWGGVHTSAHKDSGVQLQSLNAFKAQVIQAVEGGADHIIGIGSQAEYRENTVESHELNYQRAKVEASDFLRRMTEAAGIRSNWIRLFSIYGKGMDSRWLLPRLVKSCSQGDRLRLGPCNQKWGFLHVDDASAALHTVMNSNEFPYFLDLGGEAKESLRSQLEDLARVLSGPQPKFREGPRAPDSVPDLTPLKSAGWWPQKNLYEGILELLEENHVA